MLPSGESAGSPGGEPRRSDVEIASAKETVRVTLSLPSNGTRSADRRKVLERARRMLAVALEEERKKEQRGKPQHLRATETRPGCGAWWLF
jgi:hypothetical protein